MRKFILTALITLLIGAGCVGLGFSTAKSNLYKNMVNATVLIYDDFEHASAVFIDDNVILTAAHCLRDRDTINIELSDGTILESSDFYIDEKEDVGFIFVEADEPHIAKVSRTLGNIGDAVYLVGAPYNKEYKFSLFRGVISHLDRDVPYLNWSDLLQVDADAGMGNSGGPLYDVKGRLIGMYVGQCNRGGQSISLCESAESILESYERCVELRNASSKGKI